MNPHPLCLTGLTVYGETETRRQAGVLIENGKISAVIEDGAPLPADTETLRFDETCRLMPGMIDLFAHGADGSDVMDATPKALDTLCRALPQEGVTSFLAATMTQSSERIEQALGNIAAYREDDGGATPLGIYLEGPFLSAAKAGAQSPDFLRAPDIELFKHWQQLSGQRIKLAAVAPERPNALPFIEYLAAQNIIASVAHTDADYTQTTRAIEAGCRHATHLFNAMSGTHHKKPGAALAALLDDRVYVELIADGIHLPDAHLQLVYKTKPHDKILLVTDAMRAKYLPPGEYELGGQQVTVRDDRSARLTGTDTLAGSLLKMNEALKIMQRATGCSFHDLIRFSCTNPARELGVDDRKGTVAPGKDADLTVLDTRFNVLLTVRAGRVIYRPHHHAGQQMTEGQA